MTFSEDLKFWAARFLIGLMVTAAIVVLGFVAFFIYTVYKVKRGEKKQKSIPEQDRCWICRGTGIGYSIDSVCQSCWGSGKKRYLR